MLTRTAGEILVTLGVVMLLLVVYELWITDIFTARKQAQATQVLEEKWAAAEPNVVTVTRSAGTGGTTDAGPPPAKQLETDASKRTKKYDTLTGEGFAKLYIPSFGADEVYTLIEGTNDDDLATGPGHYADSQYPGQPGNFAVAGHRVTHGAPFNDAGELRSCDALVVETQDDWFVYRVLPMQDEAANWNPAARPECADVKKQTGSYAGVFGRQIVLPQAIEQTYPIPGVQSMTIPPNAERLITLTTCHPQFSDRERMIIHGVLTKSYSKAAGFLPPELGA
ncbi:class E sortase [Nakamurella sp. DB0629]|uniref:Class E sortase n=2 Tax=Nakamurella aerolata TaxID=1656892 RepID=A0A849A7G7_9ACTN|nr:class E sortase [Nakamurella aerolata]